MTVSLKVVSCLIILGLIGAVVVGVFAVTSWQQQISWNWSQVIQDFSVDGDLSVDYGLVVGQTIRTEQYRVNNVGNVPITVVAGAVPSNSSTVSASWDKLEAPISVGGSANFTLTLVISGAGFCTVTFNLKD